MRDAPLKALLVDSWYDHYLGVVILVRVKDGRLQARPEDPHDGDRRRAPGRAGRRVHARRWSPADDLGPGEIGFITAGDQDGGRLPRSATRSPTTARPPPSRCPASSRRSRWCSAASIPVDADDYEKLRESLAKLRLNDASFHYEPETSAALGFGFRCGFLGLLHLEIIQERLTREFDLDLITTAPSVVYRVHLTNGKVMELHNPVDMPDRQRDRPYRGAVDQGDDHGAGRLSRRRAARSATSGAASRST